MSLDRLIAQPRPGHHEQMPNVGREIATLMGRDPRYQNCTSADLEFLMNMGLLVREPSARNQCLAHALRMVMFYGGPSRLPRRREQHVPENPRLLAGRR